MRRPSLARGWFPSDYPIVELNAPPSSSRFWPTMKPEQAAHRKAQASPNSFGSPTRPAGFGRRTPRQHFIE